ncbi:MAG: AmmeMemoRadiSam system protein B [Leptospirillia bacterium]
MVKTRPAAVAGVFYPADGNALRRDVHSFLDAAKPSTPKDKASIKALVVPHAGFMYSGPVAASAYRLLSGREGVRRVVLLGPTHRVPVAGLAVPDCGAFATPLGNIPLDTTAMATLTPLHQVMVSNSAHAWEHSIEVQLPFLQEVLGEFSLVPLAVGDTSAKEVAEVLEVVWGGDETLVVVSSDLSHYLTYEAAQAVDTRTAELVLTLRHEDLDHNRACGAAPLSGLLEVARRKGLTARLVDLRNSGDTEGDRERVVGYGAFVFTRTLEG